MSVTQYAWAADQVDVSGLEKFALMVLADGADMGWACGTQENATARLSRVMGLPEGEVTDILVSLSEKGFVGLAFRREQILGEPDVLLVHLCDPKLGVSR